jgi:hypothetical protein
MGVMGRASIFGCVLLCAATASAGEREWRTARKAYDEARDAVESDRGRDEKALSAALTKLTTKTTALLSEDELKAVDHLLDEPLASETQSVVRMTVDGLSRVTNKRAAKAIAKALSKAKGTEKLLLIRVGAEVRQPPVLSALVKLLKDRDEWVRVATCKALSDHGESAKDSAKGPLKRLLKDSSLRVRVLAADALQTITGERPEGLPPADRSMETGLPDRFNSDRIAFLIDATAPMAEVAFSDPFAPPPEDADKDADKDAPGDDQGAEKKKEKKKKKPRRKGKGKKEKEPEPPKPFSPFQIAASLVHKAIERMGPDNRIHLARFGRSSQSYKSGFGAVPKKLDDVDSWLDASLSRDINRDLLSAVRPLIKGEAAPQQIYLFLAGSPTRRGRTSEEATIDAMRELLWTRDIELYIVSFVLEHPNAARNKSEQAARDEAQGNYLQFVSGLAQASRGAATRIDMGRLREPEKEDDKPKTDDDETGFAKGVDLTKPIASRDVSTVKKALKAAFAKHDKKAAEFVEDVAANPDPRKVALQLIDGLRGDEPDMAEAVARGIARNTNAAVHQFVFKALSKERDPARQLLLLSAVGTAKGLECSKGLAESVSDLKGDPLRMAWYYLSDRPTNDLVACKGTIVRRVKGLEGLAAFYAARALAKANGKQAPAADGLTPAADKFLPSRYMGTGTAFIVDTHRDMDQILWAPPKPKEDEKKKAEEEKDKKKGKKKKKKKKKRGKKDKGAPEEAKLPDPVSCLSAARIEVERALKAIAKSEAKANILTTSGDRWHAACATMGDTQVVSGVDYLTKARTGSKRDLWTPLRLALGDPSVEEIHLIVSGVPLRSAGAREASELLDKVREVNRAREVAIQVIYVLPPIDAKKPRSVAWRTDLLDAMNAIYEPLTKENGGRVIVRGTLGGLGEKKAKK